MDELQGLHDVVTPGPVSWAPQTPAWYVLGGFGLLILAWQARRWWRRHQANRYRKAALAELRAVASSLADPSRRVAALRSVPALLKRSALAAYPRQTVASLAGEEWLRFLDDSYGGNGFSQGPGRLLLQAAYAPATELQTLSESERRELIDLAREWVRRHRSAPGGTAVASGRRQRAA